MNSSQNFNLKWAEFQSNLKLCYSKLEKTNNFSDITLVSEGGEQIKAHRMILSATSPIFENILMGHDHPKSLIYMRGIKGSHLKLLMSYIYKGEVEVSTEELKDFLAVAGELKVKGLTTDDTLDTLLEKQTNPSSKKKQQEQFNLPEETVLNTTTEQGEIQPHSDFLVKQEEYSDSSYNEETQDVWTRPEPKSNVLMKFETTYSCDLCGKLSITHLGLLKHKSRYHSVKKTEDLNTTAAFECKVCGRKSISKGGLHKHNIRHHSNV